MDATTLYVFIGCAGGLMLAVAASAVSYNEYLYRKARGETNEPWCCCFSATVWRDVQRRLGWPITDLVTGQGKTNSRDAVSVPEVQRYQPPFKESVDCMFLVKRLKKDGLVDEDGAKRLSDTVASRDPRLLALIRKHTKNLTADSVLTRNAEFQAAFVLLSRSQKLPRVDEQKLLREAQEKKDAEAKAKEAAEREAARRWKKAAQEARAKEQKELGEGSSSEEEDPTRNKAWHHV